jgi:hypothetical protein
MAVNPFGILEQTPTESELPNQQCGGTTEFHLAMRNNETQTESKKTFPSYFLYHR